MIRSPSSPRTKGGACGYDAGKKIREYKRHLIVDTTGLVLAVLVYSAVLQDRDGAKLVLQKLLEGGFARLQLIWADGDYAGKLVQWVALLAGWTL